MAFLKHCLVLLIVVISSTFTHEVAKPVDLNNVEDVICPDGRHACPSGSTCCKLPSGVWGCCPIPNAVCCKDHLHCCPQDTVCDTIHGKCLRGVENSIPWQKKIKSRELNSTSTQANDVTCDSFSACPDGTTCCRLASGKWGCCPIPNAVCCEDHLHCYPSGTVCDTAHGRCSHKGGLSLSESFSAKVHLKITKPASVSYKTVICPDQESYCPDGSTCCLLPAGGYGCCPMPMANCCKDHLHCCPHDSICDLEHSTCRRKGIDQNDDLSELLVKAPAGSVADLTAKDICHDKQTMCANGHHCCITVDAEWGCCAP